MQSVTKFGKSVQLTSGLWNNLLSFYCFLSSFSALNVTFNSGPSIARGGDYLTVICSYDSPLPIDGKYAFLAANSDTNIGVYSGGEGNTHFFALTKYVNGTIHCGYHDVRYMKEQVLSETGLQMSGNCLSGLRKFTFRVSGHEISILIL